MTQNTSFKLRKQPCAAFVACRDSRLQVEAVCRKHGLNPRDILILSRRDNPQLHTIDDIVASLPESVIILKLDDVEYLLPEGERTLERVQALLIAASLGYAHRGLRILATVTEPDARELVQYIWRRPL